MAALNQLARERCIRAGTVFGHEVSAPGGKPVARGDRVVTLAPSGDGRFVTSDRGTVSGVDHDGLTVHFDDGRTVTLAGEELAVDRLDYAFAVTVHRMQGATADRAHVFADGGGRELGYVAMSRARESSHVYVVADSRTYASRSFPLARTNSADAGEPARFLCKVFDPEAETMVDRELDEWIIRETPAGRYQFKLLVARERGNVKELWIQRVPAPGTNGTVKNLLNLRQPEASRLIEFLRMLDAFPVEGDTTVRLDDSLLRDLLADPDSLARLYQRAPDQVRDLIRNDAAARDVLALEARRRQLQTFRRLLDDDDFFDDEVTRVPGRRPEGVWQRLFEGNPWMSAWLSPGSC